MLFLLLYLLPLGQLPLINPDELRYAEIPREMLASGDFVVPRLNGLRYFEKPPLGYWVNAASLAVFGENPFALRLPGALAAGLTALLVFLFGRRIGLGREGALTAALIQLTFGEVYFVATFGVLDSLLTLLLTGGMVCAYFAFTGERPRDGLLAGLCFGFAFLTKGFLAFVAPLIVFVPWALWCGKWRKLAGKGSLIVSMALLVALPWSIAIYRQEPDFWRYFVWVEHIERFLATDTDHASPAYSLLLQLPLLAFPWIFLAPAAVAGLRGNREGLPGPRLGPALRLLWLWLLLPFLFFSFSSGKLATYILPCFPPLALLTAAGMKRYLETGGVRLFRGGVAASMVLLGLLLAYLLLNFFSVIGTPLYASGETWKAWLLTAALLTGMALADVALSAPRLLTRLAAPGLLVAPLWFVSHYVAPQSLLELKAPKELLTDINRQLPPDTILIAKASMAGTMAWYSRRDDVYLAYSRGEMEVGLGYPDAAGRYLDGPGLESMLNRVAGKQPILILCRKACEPALVSLLPVSAQRVSNRGYERWFVPTGSSR